MSDKELIETIKKIRDHCTYSYYCSNCKFYLGEIEHLQSNKCCQISWLTGLLANAPSKWDIKKIEEVICK